MRIVLVTFLRKSHEPNFQWQYTLVIFCLIHFSLRWIIFFFQSVRSPLSMVEIQDPWDVSYLILRMPWECHEVCEGSYVFIMIMRCVVYLLDRLHYSITPGLCEPVGESSYWLLCCEPKVGLNSAKGCICLVGRQALQRSFAPVNNKIV